MEQKLEHGHCLLLNCQTVSSFHSVEIVIDKKKQIIPYSNFKLGNMYHLIQGKDEILVIPIDSHGENILRKIEYKLVKKQEAGMSFGGFEYYHCPIDKNEAQNTELIKMYEKQLKEYNEKNKQNDSNEEYEIILMLSRIKHFFAITSLNPDPLCNIKPTTELPSK
eukprot:UN33137